MDEGELETGYADGELVKVADNGRDWELLLQSFCADHGVNAELAMEYLSWFEEHMGHHASGSESKNLHPIVALEAIFRELLAAENSWLAIRVMALALDMPVLDDIVGHVNLARLAKQSDQERENVRKLMVRFQRNLSLPKRAWQKDGEACAKMQRSRRKHIQDEKHASNQKAAKANPRS